MCAVCGDFVWCVCERASVCVCVLLRAVDVCVRAGMCAMGVICVTESCVLFSLAVGSRPMLINSDTVG